jgi:hypothetical protein
VIELSGVKWRACQILFGAGLLQFGINGAVAQTAPDRINQLTRRITALEEGLQNLNRLVRNIDRLLGYATFDGRNLFVASWFRRDRDRLLIERSLPGVVNFRFKTPLEKQPIVLATPIKHLGDIPFDEAFLRLDVVTEIGFTIVSSNGSDRANVPFTVVIFKSQ